jgi:WD40 repeat protein
MTQGEECKTSQDLVQECKQFLMYARSGIEQAPLQVYVSAALFAPSRTVLRDVGRKTTPVSYVKRSPPTPEHWSALLLTLEGHSDAVTAVHFSPDGSKLASASWDKKVMVWDPRTKSPVQTISVGGYVSDLAFSPDEVYLKTNIGSSKLGSVVGETHDENACSFHLQVGDNWILRRGYRTIWLPPELRAHRSAMSVLGSFVALGHPSGTISFWEISL